VGRQVYAPLHRGEWLERLPEASIRRRAERLYQQLESDGILVLLALFLMPPSKSVILGAVDDRFRTVNGRFSKLEQQYERLLRTLDTFLKRVTERNPPF